MAKLLINTQPVSTRGANAARLSVVSGVLFVLLLGSLHVLKPEFDPTWRFISEYQLGRFGWLMHVAFLALAMSMARAGVANRDANSHVAGIHRPWRAWNERPWDRIGGNVRTDPITTSDASQTWHRALRSRFLQWFDGWKGAFSMNIRDVKILANGDIAVAHWFSRSRGTLKNGLEVGSWCDQLLPTLNQQVVDYARAWLMAYGS